jgi:glycine/serine hydroxymethyltransferase
MKEEDMMEIADLIDDALRPGADESALVSVRQKVRALTGRYPLPG